MKKGKLDKIDRKIIALLQLDARMPYTEIGDIVGLSRTSVKNRIIELEDRGFIKGYSVICRLDKIKGNPFFLTVHVKPECYKDVKERIKIYFDDFIGIFGMEDKSKIICLGTRERFGLREDDDVEKKEANFFIQSVQHFGIQGIVSISVQSITEWIKGDMLMSIGSGDIIYDKL